MIQLEQPAPLFLVSWPLQNGCYLLQSLLHSHRGIQFDQDSIAAEFLRDLADRAGPREGIRAMNWLHAKRENKP